jgi:aryl-alcohol dehydrogenase-like predicted oxidoreductase
MKQNLLGKTGISVSEIGFGCASMWGMNSFSEKDAIDIFLKAVENGVTLFDTGHNYSGGNAEARLGLAIKRLGSRKGLVLSSKCGTRSRGYGRSYKDFSPGWIRESCMLSLERIGVDHLDLYMFHSPSLEHLTDEAMAALHGLKAEGLVRAVGLSNPNSAVLERVEEKLEFDFALLNYNIMNRGIEPRIAKLHEKGVGVLAGGVLAHGLYSRGIYRIKRPRDLWYLARAVVRFRNQLIKGFSYHFVDNTPGMSGAQVALRYVLDNPLISAAVFGTTSIAHLEDNLAARERAIPEDVLNRILAIQ